MTLKFLLSLPSTIVALWSVVKDFISFYRKSVIEQDYEKDRSAIRDAFYARRLSDVGAEEGSEPSAKAAVSTGVQPSTGSVGGREGVGRGRSRDGGNAATR